MSSYPSGTVTFLFTDIEGSTTLAQNHPNRWEKLRERHHAILQSAMEVHKGYVFQIIGDAFCVAFHTASHGLRAAVDAQRILQHEEWGESIIKVRMGLHTGSAELTGSDYRGYLTMAKVQRVMSVACGGQVLLSNSCAELAQNELPAGVTMRDMKEHRLKGLPSPEHLWQILAPDLWQDFPPLQSLNEIPNNLPAQLTSFVGRGKELEDVKRLLHDAPMLTLIGSGGTGKTRLSIQSAAELLPQYTDGVWFVELAPIFDPLLVPRTTAIAIGLRDEPEHPVIDMLCDYLHEKRSLIILDNCEHLVNACAQMADRILHSAPDVRILASSREALGIAGEVTYRVPSLGLPDVDHLPSVESLNQYEAVKLFIDRAMAAVPTFTISNENAPFVAQICYRLDGIPLAIELAAAKIRALNVEQITRRLDDRFRLLTGGSRTALERHQTLRATIDWSYNLLSPAEQVLFSQLSVFVGGWTLETAESVCSVDPLRKDDVFQFLESLINKSIVIAEEAQHETRYRMLETLRQYANEKLDERDESDLLRDKHLDYFLKLAETAEPYLHHAEQIEWLKRLDIEIENLRAALHWAAGKQSAEPMLRLASALAIYWEIRALWMEGSKWLRQALSREWEPNSKSEKSARARALYRGADFGELQDDLEMIKQFAEAGAALCEEVGDKWGVAYSHRLMGLHLRRIHDNNASKALYEQSLIEFQQLGDVWAESLLMSELRWMELITGNIAKYSEYEQKALTQARISGDRSRIGDALIDTAFQLEFHHKWDQVEKLYQEADQLFAEVGLSGGSNRLHSLRADLFLAQGRLEEAKAESNLYMDFCSRVGDRNNEAYCLFILGLIAEFEHDLDKAVECLQKGLDLKNEIGEQSVQSAMFLARLQFQKGNRNVAVQIVVECLEMVRRGELAGLTPDLVFEQTSGMLVERNARTAVQLLAYTEIYWQSVQFPRHPILDQPYFDRFLAAARAKLSEADFAFVWDTGLKMMQEEAVELALKSIEEL